ncbi:MAG: hypothetical protein MN733_08580 [Nitrososphaera sp.]|nr:hypothetical protein [Nitrososphaera sp.]
MQLNLPGIETAEKQMRSRDFIEAEVISKANSAEYNTQTVLAWTQLEVLLDIRELVYMLERRNNV